MFWFILFLFFFFLIIFSSFTFFICRDCKIYGRINDIAKWSPTILYPLSHKSNVSNKWLNMEKSIFVRYSISWDGAWKCYTYTIAIRIECYWVKQKHYCFNHSRFIDVQAQKLHLPQAHSSWPIHTNTHIYLSVSGRYILRL